MTRHQIVSTERSLYLKILIGSFVGLFLGLLFLQYVQLIETGEFFWQSDLLLYARKRSLVFIAFCIIVGAGIAIWHKKIFHFLFKYRWPVACTIFFLCIIFEISGSSIGLLIDMMGGDGSVILGASRPIRSDEWMVFTPMTISQCTTDGGVFSYFQDSFRGVETDMYCVYGQPVWDIAVLFRPFQIGYLFLGASHGLAFFWCGRAIFLFMVSLEFAYRVLTEQSKPLSVAYAFLIALGAPVQWWFSVVGFLEMLIFGQLALVWLKFYLETNSYKIRALLAVGIGWCLAVFVLTFYPAWQVPFAYVYLAILAAVLIKELPRSRKGLLDLGMIAIALTIVAFAVIYVFLFKSWETIQIEMHTAYPGARSTTGGGYLLQLFWYPISLISPINEADIVPNACEVSAFFSFFPLSFLLPIAVMLKRRKPIAMLFCLIIAFLLLEWFSAIGMPEFFAKATLLDKSTAKRTLVASGFALTVLLFATLPYLKELKTKEKAAILIISIVILASGIPIQDQMFGLPSLAAIILITLFGMVVISFYNGSLRSTRSMVAGVLVISFLCGALVNPIRGNINSYVDNEIAMQVKQLSTEDDKWAVVESPFSANNIIPSLGFPTLNSTNVYPQLETWKILDPTGVYEEIYNRYAHVVIELKEEGEAEFILQTADLITLIATIEDLERIGVTKIATYGSELTENGLMKIGEAGSMKFYELTI